MDELWSWKIFGLAFLPLFVAMDPVGLVPMFLALTQHQTKRDRRRTIQQSLVTALVVTLVFLVVGQSILRFLGVTTGDFLVAGGVLLFILALSDLLREARPHGQAGALGVVPLGVPLIAGPAVLTTSLLLLDRYGMPVTAASLVLNVAIVGVLFSSVDLILRWIGTSGARVVSKLTSLLLAGFAVMLIRHGVLMLWEQARAVPGAVNPM